MSATTKPRLGATKRKSDEGTSGTKAAKQPRLTIDSFFTQQLTVNSGSGIDAMSGKNVAGKMIDVTLSAEQQRVLRMVVDDGQNVFFTGSAGT
jgi:hypothetical protein